MINKAIQWIEYFQDVYSNKFKYHLYLFGFLGLIFLFYRLYSSGGLPAEINLLDNRIILGVFFYFLSSFFQFCTWRDMLCFHKTDKRKWSLIKIHYLSLIAKYIPGVGWNYLGRNVLLDQRLGIPAKITVRMFSVEVCVTFAVLFFYSAYIFIQNLPLYIFIIIIAVSFALSFTVFYLFFRRINSEFIFGSSYWLPVIVYINAMLSFLFFIISFMVLFPGIKSFDGYVYIAGVYSFSTLIGFISPFPAGLGVREAIPLIFLTKYYGEQLVLTAALGARSIIILSDVVLFLCALLLNRLISENYNRGQP